MTTKESIIAKAVELFNEKGIEYGGLRELASILNMRVSNITYYFPTKDDLVLAIAEQLRATNNPAFDTGNINCVADFLNMYRTIFFNQYAYRCLLLSFVHIITQNAMMAKDYKRVEGKRRAQITSHLHALITNGDLQKMNAEQLELLMGNITLLTRFWISEARISYPDFSVNKLVEHYIKVLGNFLFGYATAKGRRSIKDFLK